MISLKTALSRREALRLGTAGLVSFGLWPGALRAAENGDGDEFSFVAINDTHYVDETAAPFLQRAFDLMMSGESKPDFCLMSGDFSEHGTEEELSAIRELFGKLGIPVHGVIGNHDYATQTDRKAYESVFPNRINYRFEHRGWQGLCLDTTQGTRASRTTIADATLSWLDEALPKLDKSRPTIVVSHFPLGPNVANRPLNADSLLERFLDYNLQAAFCGHWHGQSERKVRNAILTTDRCCSFTARNHDGSADKGFYRCRAAQGRVTREFVAVSPA